MYFIPRAYPHHIDNTGTDPWHFLIFFDQPTPADIGYRPSPGRSTPPSPRRLSDEISVVL